MSSVSSAARPPEQVTPEALLRRLEWRVIRRLDGLLQGDYRTLFYGTGSDFADLREYELRDDVRHIDWNVTARLDRPHVRQYVEDRELTAWFLLDLSPSMGFGPAVRPKRRVLIECTATLARLLTRGGNRVGAILFNNRLERTLPPRSNRNQILWLIRELGRERAAPRGTTTDLSRLLEAAYHTVRRRSLLFLVSDFISRPGWERPLAMLARRHELVALRLDDPRERELPDAGLIVLEDAESGEQLMVDTSDPTFRRRFAEAARRRDEALTSACRRAGVELFTLSTEEDLVGAIVRMAATRKRRRR